MIESQRHLFDLPPDVAYFNCAYMSPLMNAVVQAGQRAVARKARPWTIGSQDFFSESEQARTLFATLINGRAQDVSIIPSASYGIETAVRNLPLAAGQEVLVLEDQFPSNLYPWLARAGRVAARVRKVAAGVDADLNDPLCEAISDCTAVVALPHCRWTDGALLDLPRIAARCREAGAALVLDLTQSAGVLPVDVQRVQPDFLVCACYKWLMGPYSLGFMYVHPRWHHGEALEQNWITRAGSEDFSRLVVHEPAYQPGARRFDMGERANFHLMPMAVVALQQLLAWGVDEVAVTLAARNLAIQAALEGLGLACPAPRRRAGHFLSARVPGGVPEGLVERLAREQVHLSVRGDSLRITPHVYNDDSDVQRLLSCLEAAL